MAEEGDSQDQKKTQAARRKAFLRNNKINPDLPVQFTLVFPLMTQGDLRHIPNDLARSSLFTAVNRNVPRKAMLRATLFHYSESVSIVYTGQELRGYDDEIIWMQLLQYAVDVPAGQPIKFNIKDLMRDVKWPRNGDKYKQTRDCLSRMRATELLLKNDKAYGRSGGVSLIGNIDSVNDEFGSATEYIVSIDPALILLFAGNSFTSHKWVPYLRLSPTARKLADYIESHKKPYPLALLRFAAMCGWRSPKTTDVVREYRKQVRRACKEIVEAGIIAIAYLDKGDHICFHEALPASSVDNSLF